MEMVEIAQGHGNEEKDTKGRKNRFVRLISPISVYLRQFPLDPLVEDTLQLDVGITCASPPHSRVVCCSSCQAREVCHLAIFLALFINVLQRPSASPESWPNVCALSGMNLTHPRLQMLRPMVQLSPSTLSNLTVRKCSASLLVPLSFPCVSPVIAVTTASELASMFISPCPTTLAELLVPGPLTQ